MIFQTSSLAFGQAKQQVAESAGKQQTPEFLDRAGRAIEYAIRQWNKHNWKWTAQEATFPVIANTAQYAIPHDFRDVYTLRLEGMFDRALVQKSRRDFDRRTWKQVPSYPVAYNTLWVMPQGMLELMPYPVINETGHLRYYSRMTIPCAATTTVSSFWTESADNFTTYTYRLIVNSTKDITIGSPYTCANAVAVSGGATISSIGTVIAILSTTSIRITSNIAHSIPIKWGTIVVGGDDQFLDIPETYSDDILALATLKFLIGIGASPDRISHWKYIADTGLANALAAENEAEDDDVGFQPPTHEPGHFLAPFIVTSQ